MIKKRKHTKHERKITPAHLTRFLRVYMRQHPYTRSVVALQLEGRVDIRARTWQRRTLCVTDVSLWHDEPEPPKRGGVL